MYLEHPTIVTVILTTNMTENQIKIIKIKF